MKKISIGFILVAIFAFFVINTPVVQAYNNNINDNTSLIRLQNTVTDTDDDDTTTNDDTNTDDDVDDDNTDNDTIYDNDTTEALDDDEDDIFTNLLYGVIGLLIGIAATYLFTNPRKIR